MQQKNTLYLVLATAFLLKIAYIILGDIAPITFENTAIAQNYLSTGTMFYELDGNIDFNHQFPLFGWVLIAFFKVFGVTFLPVQIFQVALNVLFAGIVVQIYSLVIPAIHQKLWMAYTLLLVGLFHPLLFYYQVYTVHPVTLDVLLFTLLLFAGLKWQRNINLQNSLLLLVVLGLTLLERSTLIMALLPTFILVLKNKKSLLQLSLISILSLVVFAAPWMARNHYHTGKYQLTSGTWRYLWVGVQEETNGTNVLENGESYYSLFPQDVKDHWSEMTLPAQMDFYRNSYLEIWQTNPFHVVKMGIVKMKNMFWFSTVAGGISQDSWWVKGYKLLHGLLLILCVIGIFTRHRNTILILLSATFTLAILQSLFYVETRHAMPFQFILWMAAVLGAEKLFEKSFLK